MERGFNDTFLKHTHTHNLREIKLTVVHSSIIVSICIYVIHMHINGDGSGIVDFSVVKRYTKL